MDEDLPWVFVMIHIKATKNPWKKVELIGKYYSSFSSTIEICEVPVVPCIVCFPTLTRGEEGFWTLEWAGALLGPVRSSVDPVNCGWCDLGEHCRTLHLLEEYTDDSLASIFSRDQGSPHVPFTREVGCPSSVLPSYLMVLNAQMFTSRKYITVVMKFKRYNENLTYPILKERKNMLGHVHGFLLEFSLLLDCICFDNHVWK